MTLIKFESIPIKENHEPLVDLEKAGIIVEFVYYNQKLAPDQRLFLRDGAVKKIEEIEKKISPYKFKVWDGFRSREVQNNIYNKYRDELKSKNPSWNEEKLVKEVEFFVTKASDPNKIPPHATGGAIDLTLIDSSGKELDMGTAFDYFGPEASALYFEKNNVNETIRKNRKILRDAMLDADFRADEDEWWHFDFGNQLWALALDKPYAIYGEAHLNK